MPYDEEQRLRLNEEYSRLTGKQVQWFVCPITLRDVVGAELCAGHILNKSIEYAPRATLVQWQEIDNHFGQTIEPELVRFLNTPVLSPEQLFSRLKNVTVTDTSGETKEAFFAGPAARAKFQQLDLIDKDGNIIASPYLRSGAMEPRLHKGLQVEWDMKFTNSALLGSLLKSAYLAMFRHAGYRWTLDPAGEKLRQSLAAFYDERATIENSLKYFREYDGAFNVMLGDLPPDQNESVKDGCFWFHFSGDGSDRNSLFAMTCLFMVNRRLVTVTIPATMHRNLFASSYDMYHTLLKNRDVPQTIRRGLLSREQCQIESAPITIKYAPRPAGSGSLYPDPKDSGLA